MNDVAESIVMQAGGSWFHDASVNNFFRLVQNFIIDMRACDHCLGLSWSVAQATSIVNCHFMCSIGSQCRGLLIESGSGGFMSDLEFEGGVYGMVIGNQQFTSRNIVIHDTSQVCVFNTLLIRMLCYMLC